MATIRIIHDGPRASRERSGRAAVRLAVVPALGRYGPA